MLVAFCHIFMSTLWFFGPWYCCWDLQPESPDALINWLTFRFNQMQKKRERGGGGKEGKVQRKWEEKRKKCLLAFQFLLQLLTLLYSEAKAAVWLAPATKDQWVLPRGWNVQTPLELCLFLLSLTSDEQRTSSNIWDSGKDTSSLLSTHTKSDSCFLKLKIIKSETALVIQ